MIKALHAAMIKGKGKKKWKKPSVGTPYGVASIGTLFRRCGQHTAHMFIEGKIYTLQYNHIPAPLHYNLKDYVPRRPRPRPRPRSRCLRTKSSGVQLLGGWVII